MDKDKNNLPIMMVKEFFLGLGRVSILLPFACCRTKGDLSQRDTPKYIPLVYAFIILKQPSIFFSRSICDMQWVSLFSIDTMLDYLYVTCTHHPSQTTHSNAIYKTIGLGDRIAVELDAGAHNVTGCPVRSVFVLWCPGSLHSLRVHVGEAPL
jgi:hypothetical protein